MKRRFLATVFALMLCISLVTNVYAATETGITPGGTGSTGIRTKATLTVTAHTATAKTWAGATSDISLDTTVNYYYMNGSGHLQTNSSTGEGFASCGNSFASGIRATSYHTVTGGSVHGNWSASLSDTAS